MLAEEDHFQEGGQTRREQGGALAIGVRSEGATLAEIGEAGVLEPGDLPRSLPRAQGVDDARERPEIVLGRAEALAGQPFCEEPSVGVGWRSRRGLTGAHVLQCATVRSFRETSE